MEKNYQALKVKNLIAKLKPQFDSGTLFLRHDGKITHKTRLAHNTPWIHHKLAPNRVCSLYHIYFNHLGIIHSRCQECWKVVVRPRTLVELDILSQLQNALDYPSKCGIEVRNTVHGLYGGYFYNDSLEEGQECYKVVRANVDENISPDVVVLLKRGCTEFEVGNLPSDQWTVSEEQVQLEKLLNDIVVHDATKLVQPDHLKEAVFQSWIEWAYGCGDATYKEYTNGEPLHTPYVTYHTTEKIDKKQFHRQKITSS